MEKLSECSAALDKLSEKLYNLTQDFDVSTDLYDTIISLSTQLDRTIGSIERICAKVVSRLQLANSFAKCDVDGINIEHIMKNIVKVIDFIGPFD